MGGGIGNRKVGDIRGLWRKDGYIKEYEQEIEEKG